MEDVLPGMLMTIGQALCVSGEQSPQALWRIVLETARSQLTSPPVAPLGAAMSRPSRDYGTTLAQLFLITCYDVFTLAKCYQEAPWAIGDCLSRAQRRAASRCRSLTKLSRPAALVKSRGAATEPSLTDDEADYCDDLPDIFDQTPCCFRRGPRDSVRADQLAAESVPVYQKEPRQRREIEEALNTSFVFEAFSVPPQAETHVNLRQRLIDALKPIELVRGSWVMREGDTGDGMYFVGRGRVEIVRGGTSLRVLRAGDLFGELAVLHPCTRSYACRTLTDDTLLYYLDRASYQTLIKARQAETLMVTSGDAVAAGSL